MTAQLPLERIWNSKTVTANGCWEWTRSRQSEGYGFVTVKGRSRNVHRVAWQLAVGPIPEGMQVLHHCDNPPCFNPTHLFLGTNADNVADRGAKGRGRMPSKKGERNPAARMTERGVLEMRRLRAAGQTCAVLARQFGIESQSVWRICTRRTWPHI